MNNTTKSPAAIANSLLEQGLSVQAQIEADVYLKDGGSEEYAAAAADLEALIAEHGLRTILELLRLAAEGAADVHADAEDEDVGVATLRLQILSKRLAHALDALR